MNNKSFRGRENLIYSNSKQRIFIASFARLCVTIIKEINKNTQCLRYVLLTQHRPPLKQYHFFAWQLWQYDHSACLLKGQNYYALFVFISSSSILVLPTIFFLIRKHVVLCKKNSCIMSVYIPPGHTIRRHNYTYRYLLSREVHYMHAPIWTERLSAIIYCSVSSEYLQRGN